MPEVRKALYSPNETAEYLDISRASVYNLIRAGRLRTVKIGAHTKILAESLEEFVQELARAG